MGKINRLRERPFPSCTDCKYISRDLADSARGLQWVYQCRRVPDANGDPAFPYPEGCPKFEPVKVARSTGEFKIPPDPEES